MLVSSCNHVCLHCTLLLLLLFTFLDVCLWNTFSSTKGCWEKFNEWTPIGNYWLFCAWRVHTAVSMSCVPRCGALMKWGEYFSISHRETCRTNVTHAPHLLPNPKAEISSRMQWHGWCGIMHHCLPYIHYIIYKLFSSKEGTKKKRDKKLFWSFQSYCKPIVKYHGILHL